jgi:hypothetical protein
MGNMRWGQKDLQSLVKFDGLTMSGKVNLYWLMAQTYRVMQDKSHYEEALYAFVVLAPLVADADKEIARTFGICEGIFAHSEASTKSPPWEASIRHLSLSNAWTISKKR